MGRRSRVYRSFLKILTPASISGYNLIETAAEQTAPRSTSNMDQLSLRTIHPSVAPGHQWLKSLSAVPTSGYLLFIILAIGLLILLSGDFGESWDVPQREYSSLKAYTFYFKGFDAAEF